MLMTAVLLAAACGGKEQPVTEDQEGTVQTTPTALEFDSNGGSKELKVTAAGPFQAYSNESWITVEPSYSAQSEGTVTVTVPVYPDNKDRTGEVVVKCGTYRHKVALTQKAPQMVVPEGYHLVWNDEFAVEEGKVSAENWKLVDMAPRTVNDERQRYVTDGSTAFIKGGALNIVAQKVEKEVQSARMNSRQDWLYGYFEARLWLPKGKGTWPAFWMMPTDESAHWPHCGEIDIMEEVGYNPNVTTSSIHCTRFNGSSGTQKTAEKKVDGLEDSYHVYALEWTPEYIQTWVDGMEVFRYENDMAGDPATWPYDKPFYIILNLAWGGTWGGAKGIDENALPCTYKIDYVRVFQK